MIPSLESEISELREDLSIARSNVADLQGQLVQASKAYENMKEKKEKHQSDLSKFTKANARLRSEKDELEKTIADLNAEVERLHTQEQN